MKMTNIQGLREEIKILHEVQLGIEVLNNKQCKNLLVNFQNGVDAIQSIMDGLNGADVFHQVGQEMLGVMKKGRCMVEECCKVEDWYQVVVMQMNNKESFRELLSDFDYCFHTLCDIFCHSFPDRKVEIQDIENSTTFYPTSIDQVEQDQNAIFERLSKEVDLCRIDDCKDHCVLLRYLMERLKGLEMVAGGELDSIVFPYIYPSPEYGTPEPLGKGGSGNVYSTKWLGFDTATKVIKVDGLDYEANVWKEASILGVLDHPNIIRMFCCGLKEKTFEIVMERGDMSLSKFLELNEKPLVEETAVDIMIQIASGMCYFHDMKVAHRDLKPDNVILISQVGSKQEHVHVKILDFGISKIEVKNSPQMPTNGGCFGTSGYMAPEAYSKRSSEVDALKSDVFSFGMMCYEILSNKRASIAMKVGDYVKLILENERPKLPKTCSKDLKSLIHKCWSSEPLERPTFLDISKKLRKFKSDAMVKVASDVEVANAFEEFTTTNNLIEYSKQCWTMLMCKLHGLNIWPIFLMWQMFITIIQWFSSNLPNSLEINAILSSAQEDSNITTLKQMPYEVCTETNRMSKLIGLQGKILKLEKQLYCVGSLGIVGMGGIGKSTLAKALVNHISHQFDVTCFVGDFTDVSCTIDVEYKLQDVRGSPQTNIFREGHTFLKKLQRTKKVLVVLDNVGKASQLEVLLGDHTCQGVDGNKLIATSCSWKSLEQYMPTIGRVDMQTLDEEQSKELFSIHAFAANQPCLPYLEHVVEKIVKACDGLPLSLEVMGSCLYGEKSLRIWERTLQRLLRARHDGSKDGKIWRTLRISFDELNEREQSMFLDIVCFICKGSWFSGWVYTKSTILRMFGDVKITQQTLENLEDKSLLKFDQNGTLEVHDQLRHMGHMIVEKEFKQTRKWNLSLATSLKYWNDKSIEHVEGLSFIMFERTNFSFQKNVNVNAMKDLRFLSVKNCDHIDMLLEILRKTTKLKWLRIHFSTLHDNNSEQHTHFINQFMNIVHEHLRQLGVLELFNIKICTPIIFHHLQSKVLKELSFIDCTFPCANFPHGCGNVPLEQLYIYNSKDLETLPEDLKQLTTLTHLNISKSEMLKEFPSGICTLKALEVLSFYGCKSLKTMPEGIRNLTCLKKLHMWDCTALEEFPSGICTLEALEELSFGGCKSLKTIPEGIRDLTCLKKLHVGLYNLGIVSFRNMHPQGLEGIKISWMQLFEDNA